MCQCRMPIIFAHVDLEVPLTWTQASHVQQKIETSIDLGTLGRMGV